MGATRFPYIAFNRRCAEAHGMDEPALIRWLTDRTRAKRLAARAELRLRYLGREHEMPKLHP